MCECCGQVKDLYLPQLATVNETKMMNETELYLHLSMDDEPLEYRPGQFVEVSIPGFGEAPISISSSPTKKDGFEIVVRRIGNVTNMIHKLKTGDKIGIRGPFGEGCYPAEQALGKDLVFICGGIGLVPQRSFINYVLDNRGDYGDITILLGTKNEAQRFYRSELQEWSQRDDIHLLESIDQAEDGWQGNVGVVTTLIPKVESDWASSLVFICGPPIMYKFVLLTLADFDMSSENIFVNLERKMKCGVGKCGHCQINQYYVCMDGPVFRYSELGATPEAI